MTVSQQIKMLCARLNISNAELARRLNLSPQALCGRMKRESFTVSDLEAIAEVTGVKYVHLFVLDNDEKI